MEIKCFCKLFKITTTRRAKQEEKRKQIFQILQIDVQPYRCLTFRGVEKIEWGQLVCPLQYRLIKTIYIKQENSLIAFNALRLNKININKNNIKIVDDINFCYCHNFFENIAELKVHFKSSYRYIINRIKDLKQNGTL